MRRESAPHEASLQDAGMPGWIYPALCAGLL